MVDGQSEGLPRRAHQHGRPPKGGGEVKRQLRPDELSLLSSLESLIASQNESLIGLTDNSEIQKIKAQRDFNKSNLRSLRIKYGQPVEP